jgi:hypothetical protein
MYYYRAASIMHVTARASGLENLYTRGSMRTVQVRTVVL